MTDDEIRLAKILKLLGEWQPGDNSQESDALFAMWDALLDFGFAEDPRGDVFVRRAEQAGLL